MANLKDLKQFAEELLPIVKDLFEGAARGDDRGDTRAERRALDRLRRLGLVGEPQPASPPRQLGKYRLERRLGAGGMGVVFLAHDGALDRRVALKTLPVHIGLSGRARERFQREVRAVAQLHHPHIVQFLGSASSVGRPPGHGMAPVRPSLASSTVSCPSPFL